MGRSDTWLVVIEVDASWLSDPYRTERIAHAATAAEAVEVVLRGCSVLDHKRGITATVHRVVPKAAGSWRSQYEHPERDDGPHEHCPDYGKSVTVKL